MFGSFTEDEIRSMQITPTEKDVHLIFGSLDDATLRSVGFNNKPTEIEITKKNQTLKPVKVSNTDEVVLKNGNIDDSSSFPFSNGIKDNEEKDVELPVSFVPESVDLSTSQQCVTETVTVPSVNQEDDVLSGSFEALDVNDTRNQNLSPSIGPHTVSVELLPRGLVNSGNLCFLNATLQALLACSPFVLLLQELRMRKIPEVNYIFSWLM